MVSKKNPVRKTNHKKRKEIGRIIWTGLIWVNEDDLTNDGKMHFRLGELAPKNLN
jgi:hypothetical protein